MPEEPFILLEAYGMLGAFLGAKLLYFIVSFKTIDWKRMMEPLYFNQIMQSGFVFYGGLLGGLFFIIAAGKIHKIEEMTYIRTFIFLIPFIHCFGRIGCFMAGCCYGIRYDGIGAIIFPKDSYAMPDVKLFPVQLVEAFFLFLIAAVVFFIQVKGKKYTVKLYFLLYSCLRFGLEYLRNDEIRGVFIGLSTSQWISIALFFFAIFMPPRPSSETSSAESKSKSHEPYM